MPYIEGFVAAVPTANKEAYREHAQEAMAYFKKLGATRLVECWGDDVPKGALTDFYKATQARDDETPVFSWIEYPDKATRDAANKKMGEDPNAANIRADRQRVEAGEGAAHASPSLAFSKHLLGDEPARKRRKTLSLPQGERKARAYVERPCSDRPEVCLPRGTLHDVSGAFSTSRAK